jgi:hypothetical protein
MIAEFFRHTKEEPKKKDANFLQTFSKQIGPITPKDFSVFSRELIKVCKDHFGTLTYELLRDNKIVLFKGMNLEDELDKDALLAIQEGFRDADSIVLAVYPINNQKRSDASIQWHRDHKKDLYVEGWAGITRSGEVTLGQKLSEKMLTRKNLGLSRFTAI